MLRREGGCHHCAGGGSQALDHPCWPREGQVQAVTLGGVEASGCETHSSLIAGRGQSWPVALRMLCDPWRRQRAQLPLTRRGAAAVHRGGGSGRFLIWEP